MVQVRVWLPEPQDLEQALQVDQPPLMGFGVGGGVGGAVPLQSPLVVGLYWPSELVLLQLPTTPLGRGQLNLFRGELLVSMRMQVVIAP